jgi:chemotaxis protein MotA
MDIATVIGLLLAWGGISVAIFESGIPFSSYISTEGIFIVIFGTLGATVVSYPMPALLNSLRVAKNAFFSRESDFMGTIQILVGFATQARREGLLGLEENVDQLEDKFLQKGMQLVVDGTEGELVRNIMETDLAYLQARHKQGTEMFMAAGGFAPTLGVIAAVMGLVAVLGTVGDDMSMMLRGVATAFVGTFYGISTANLFWLPIANKLKARSEEEILIRQVMIEGVLSISVGDNPRIVEEKLKAFLPPKFKQMPVTGGGRPEAGREEAGAGAGAGAARR